MDSSKSNIHIQKCGKQLKIIYDNEIKPRKKHANRAFQRKDFHLAK